MPPNGTLVGDFWAACFVDAKPSVLSVLSLPEYPGQAVTVHREREHRALGAKPSFNTLPREKSLVSSAQVKQQHLTEIDKPCIRRLNVTTEYRLQASASSSRLTGNIPEQRPRSIEIIPARSSSASSASMRVQQLHQKVISGQAHVLSQASSTIPLKQNNVNVKLEYRLRQPRIPLTPPLIKDPNIPLICLLPIRRREGPV
jgi:hypothetical protein